MCVSTANFESAKVSSSYHYSVCRKGMISVPCHCICHVWVWPAGGGEQPQGVVVAGEPVPRLHRHLPPWWAAPQHGQYHCLSVWPSESVTHAHCHPSRSHLDMVNISVTQSNPASQSPTPSVTPIGPTLMWLVPASIDLTQWVGHLHPVSPQ